MIHLDYYGQMLEAVSAELKAFDLEQQQLESMARVGATLLAGQEQINLTAIRDVRGVARHHIADSLVLWKLKREWLANANCVDIGTGGGFPLLPLATIEPASNWIGIESVGKKVRHLEECVKVLDLANTTLINARAEDTARGNLRDSTDIVVARAVGPLIALAEVGLPHLKVGGRLVLYKTEQTLPELEEAVSVLEQLGASKPAEVLRYRLDDDQQDRTLIVITKTGKTPEMFPRAAGVPFKKPL